MFAVDCPTGPSVGNWWGRKQRLEEDMCLYLLSSGGCFCNRQEPVLFIQSYHIQKNKCTVSMIFSIYEYGLCHSPWTQQGYPGNPGPPGPLQSHNSSDTRGETTALTVLCMTLAVCILFVFNLYGPELWHPGGKWQAFSINKIVSHGMLKAKNSIVVFCFNALHSQFSFSYLQMTTVIAIHSVMFLSQVQKGTVGILDFLESQVTLETWVCMDHRACQA